MRLGKRCKRIVIWGASEHAASILRIVLDAWGYAVEMAAEERRLYRKRDAPDAVLLLGFDDGAQARLARKLYRARTPAGVAFQSAHGTLPEAVWIAQLRDRLKLATLRKRGPRAAESQNMQAARAAATHAAERLAARRMA